MKPRVGITLGDVTGIGPEVTFKALAQVSAEGLNAAFTVIGGRAVVDAHQETLACPIPSSVSIEVHDPDQRDPASGEDPLDGWTRWAPGAAPAARAAVRWIREGARLCLEGHLDALVTAPVNKHAIVEAGVPFIGHTELLSEMAGEPRTVMMLLGQDDRQRWLRVALATVHIALRDVPMQLTTQRVQLAITRAVQACHDLGVSRARVGVCGLNPHAGEGGAFGEEEAKIIQPAIDTVRAAGMDTIGPLSADTAFHQALHGQYDAVVAMYHDQGLAPLKLVAFNTGVNWTLGLPFIRTSPDHGTAYDIAGTGTADPSSMAAAIQMALRLAHQR